MINVDEQRILEVVRQISLKSEALLTATEEKGESLSQTTLSSVLGVNSRDDAGLSLAKKCSYCVTHFSKELMETSLKFKALDVLLGKGIKG